MSDDRLLLRKYRVSDRQAVRKICCDTAFMGKPCTIFFDSEEIFADALTNYFTDYEPQSCFVAELDGVVVGYLFGAIDVKRMEMIFARRILPGLLIKAFFSGVFLRPKNIHFIAFLLRSMLKGELRQPDFSHDYPATLHINICSGFRGRKIGSQLIVEYLMYLKGEGIKGVHLATMSEDGVHFFEKQGFQVLLRARRSYFRYLLNRDILVCIYGRQLI